jgi:hypothetical protein
VQAKDTETDPWGRDLDIKYERKDKAELLTIRSLGADGLVYTSDDVVYRYQVSQRGFAERAVEQGAASVGRGLIKGVVDGVRETK